MANLSNSPSTRASSKDLRRLSALNGVCIAFAGLALVAIIAYAGWQSNNSSLLRERTLLLNGLNRSIAHTLSEQKSVAWWDDSVTKITDAAVDLEFTDANFGDFLTETYGHHEVYILNGENKPLYAFKRNARRDPAAFEPLRFYLSKLIAEVRGDTHSGLKSRPDIFRADQSHYNKLGGPMELARWAGHILSVNGRLAIVAAISIVPNVDLALMPKTPNMLISVRYIDARFVADLSHSLLLHDLAILPEATTSNGFHSERLDGDDGTRGGYFVWSMDRPGHVLLSSILPLVVIGVIGVAILANGMLLRLKHSSDKLAEREMQSRYDARHDALSKLPNRPHFVEMLRDTLERLAKKNDGTFATVAYVDLDRFKDVNDTLGHHAGDELIKAVARRLEEQLRPDDVLSRYGGDEFAILWLSSSAESSNILATRIQRAFERRFDVLDQSLSVTASTGIAIASARGISVDELMRQADIALYEAKTLGRNRAVLFAEEMAQRVEERRAIELDLRIALDDGQLRLNYQPILSCRTGEIKGVEALLRWRHPVKGEIPPGRFIAIAEQSGLMPELGEWVLRRAMEDWWKWPHLQVAVNLSPVQFRQVDIESLLKCLISETRITPSRFVLEITEGVLMESTERTSQTLAAIHDMGFLTALDDFGTGYSSLSYLCNFRFDKIKIDRSFVSGLSKSDSYRNIVNAVVALGKGLGMSIVAEGVETKAEAAAMSAFGCTEVQGYYFSRPLETEQMCKLMETHVATPMVALEEEEETLRLIAAS